MTAVIAAPTHLGSYAPEDVTMLLTELRGTEIELPTAVREHLMQNGGHYAESLPIEYEPLPEYEALFQALLAQHADRIALLTMVLAERVRELQPRPVLVSLARAGTPVGVLLRRALARVGVDAPHYTVSIVRGKGLDARALAYLLERHVPGRLVFVDGWTGKGAIRDELARALQDAAALHGVEVPVRLAVLADPAHVADIAATRSDELIPSACLNSTISGLISRTVVRPDLTGAEAFHGVRFYRELAHRDRSATYVDTIAARFAAAALQLEAGLAASRRMAPADRRGMADVRRVQAQWRIDDVHRVKPGIGETTRVLLRRLPHAILVDPSQAARLEHVMMLARQRGVPIIERSGGAYACYGLIEDRRG